MKRFVSFGKFFLDDLPLNDRKRAMEDLIAEELDDMPLAEREAQLCPSKGGSVAGGSSAGSEWGGEVSPAAPGAKDRQCGRNVR